MSEENKKDPNYPVMVYTDKNTPDVSETFPKSGVFCKTVADKKEEAAALKAGFRKTLKAGK